MGGLGFRTCLPAKFLCFPFLRGAVAWLLMRRRGLVLTGVGSRSLSLRQSSPKGGNSLPSLVFLLRAYVRPPSQQPVREGMRVDFWFQRASKNLSSVEKLSLWLWLQADLKCLRKGGVWEPGALLEFLFCIRCLSWCCPRRGLWPRVQGEKGGPELRLDLLSSDPPGRIYSALVDTDVLGDASRWAERACL